MFKIKVLNTETGVREPLESLNVQVPQTHDEWNQAQLRAIKRMRMDRNFVSARAALSHFRLIRKLQKQAGV